MRRLLIPAACALGLCAAIAPAPAWAHEGNPNYRSIIESVSPKMPGVKLQVLNFDDRLELTNRSTQTVVVYDYQQPPDPYARILPNGTVQVNQNSQAAYINDDRTEDGAKVPAGVTGKGAPRWKTQDRSGVFQWHDHRMHWMAKGDPPQVKDKAKRTKVFDWRIPLSVGASRGAIAGQLVWVGKDSGGVPAGAIVGLGLLVVIAAVTTVWVRRRRDAAADGDADDADAGGAAREAW